MIDHEEINCTLELNGTQFNDGEFKQLKIYSVLDRPFNVNFTLASTQALNFFNTYLRAPCALKISGRDTPAYYFNGTLTRINLIHKNTADTYIYEFTLEPMLSLYRDEAYQFLFNGVSVLEISKQILWGRQFNIAPHMFQQYNCKLLGDRTYPPLYRILMRDESLLDFWQRLLHYQGLNYYFDYTQEKTPLIISDAVNHFATNVAVAWTPQSPHTLTLKPYIENIYLLDNFNLPNNILSTGAPPLAPNTLLTHSQPVFTKLPASAVYHLNSNEQLERNSKIRADIASLALQGAHHSAKFQGGGLLFAGMTISLTDANTINTEWLIQESQLEIHFDTHDPNRLGNITTQITAQDAAIRYQTKPQFGEHASLMSGIELGTPGTDKGSNLLSVNEQGHYHATLPPTISSNDEAHNVHIFDTRMLHPMHSNDHSSHMTLPSASEGVLLWSEGFSGEPLMLGTLNNLDNAHPTTIDNPQDAYWQDNDTNKLGFVNQGTFKPFEKTGRNAATIMESPNYDPQNHQSYVRMGDGIHKDAAYPSQAAEPGLFVNTSGNYQEQHQGGLVTLAGNLNQDSQANGFTPTLRQMIQINPLLDTYHMLDSTTAHVHNEIMTSDKVTQTHQQDATSITKTLESPLHLQSFNADTTHNIYVKQTHQTFGSTTTQIYNTHSLTSESTTTTLLEMGDSTSESHDTHTLNLYHRTNQLTSNTHTANINAQTTQVNALTQNFAHYTGKITTLNANAEINSINATAAALGGNNFNQNSQLLINAKSAVPNIPDMFLVNQQGITSLQNEAAPQKKEIIFLLDCPQNPPTLQLSVNNLNPINITPNTQFIYPLTEQQKNGPITLAAKSDTQPIANTLHPDIRKINLQHNCPPEAQMPQAYFNQKGQLPIYHGITDLGKDCGMPNNMAKDAHTLMCFDAKNSPKDIKSGLNKLVSWSDTTVQWLNDQFTQSIGDINTWITNTSGVDADGDYDNFTTVIDKNNRSILSGFIKTGILKATQVGDKIILTFPFTQQFRSYVNFFISSGGSGVGMISEVKADKSVYLAQKGIQLIRLAKTFAKMTPDEQNNFNKNLNDYKSLSGKDLITDFIIINIFDLIKKNITHENLHDYFADIAIDNTNNLAATLMTFTTDGLANVVFKSGTISLVSAKIFGQYYVVTHMSDNIVAKENAQHLHENIANSQLVENASNFMSNMYNDINESKYTHAIFKKLALMIQNGSIEY